MIRVLQLAVPGLGLGAVFALLAEGVVLFYKGLPLSPEHPASLGSSVGRSR